MAFRLGQHPLAGIYQEHSQICRRCAGCHIARILLMTGGIGDDKLSVFCGKKTISNINRDALFTFRCQAVDQKSEVNILTLCANFLRVLLKCSELVLKNHF